MKILYLGCHEILEYDDIKLFLELGHEVFPTGPYLHNSNIHRKNIENLHIDENLKSEWEELKKNQSHRDGREIEMTSSFLDNFDTVVVIHSMDWILLNLDVFKNKSVILRTIGQNLPQHEQIIQKYKNLFKIVRYSPAERRLPNYAGEDSLIRFYKDENEFKDWNGNDENIINFSRSLNSRMNFCNGDTLKKLSIEIGLKIYGEGNEIISPLNCGIVPDCEFMSKLKNSRGYFYAGTKPASYTLNFMEAFMTGTPVVSIGRKLGEFFGLDLLEIPHIIKNGYNGFISDDYSQIKQYCLQLLEDKELAKEISKNARNSAIELFGKQKIKKQWEDLLRI